MSADLDIVGTAGVDVVPIAPLFNEKLRAMVLPLAEKLGRDLGQKIGDALTLPIARAIPRAVEEGVKASKAGAARGGESTGGAFADSLRAKLTAAFKAMPKLDVGLTDTGVDAQLARLRAKLEDLRAKRIGIDISAEDADRKISDLDARLARLGASSPNVRVRVDTATARAALADFRAEVAEATRSPLDVRVRVGGFEQNLISRVEAVQAALPAIQIDADTDRASASLDRYRAELAVIPVRLRTDAEFTSVEATAEVDRLRVRLDELSRNRTATVDVRADAARAAAELAAISAEVDALSVKRADIKVDTSGAQGAVLALAINIAALAAIPAIPVLGAGVGALVSAFAAAGAGAGAFGLVAIPAIKGVAAALQAQTQASNETTKATSAQANAGNTAAQRALQMAGAQQALASAQRSAAQQIYSANEQIQQSERAVADAAQAAAEQRKTALASVTAAEKSLADAQRASKAAEDDLSAARKKAADQLASLSDQLADGDLSAREADLRVQRAAGDLKAAKSSPKTNPLDLAGYQLAYDQAVQAQKEQAQALKGLKESADAQRKAGVDGADVVKTAQQKLTDAQAKAVDQAKALADAQANVGKVEASSARAVADAQKREADAYRNAANVRANAADSIVSAERGIASARLSASKVTVDATTKEDLLQKALAKLTPAGRDLYDAIAGPRGLKVAFTAWSNSLQPQVLPLFTRGVDSAKATLPGLTPLVLSAADGIGVLYDKASAALRTPFWKSFKSDIATSAQPAIVGLGVAFGHTLAGMAGIVDAFLPHMAGIAKHMDRITGRFANFGKGLKGSPAFESFLEYVKTNGPLLAEFIGHILSALTDVSKALAPASTTMFSILGPLLDGIGWLATNIPDLVRAMYALYLVEKLIALGTKALAVPIGIYNTIVALATLETWSWAAAIEATGIPELILIIVVAVGALTYGIIWAYKNVGWFQTAVDASWTAIKVASLFLWNSVLKPTFSGIVTAIQWTGKAAVWLWQTAIGPAFQFIWEAGKIMATILAVVVFGPLYIGVRILGAVFSWLWTYAVGPAFRGIATGATWLWKTVLSPIFRFIGDGAVVLYRGFIKPQFDLMVITVRALGDAASWAWRNVLRPTFALIGEGAHILYDKSLRPVFDLIKSGISKVADAFDVAGKSIAAVWRGIEDNAKTPVKFVVDNVYNNAIRPVWNDVAKITGVGKLDKIDLKNWATGGVLPGYTPGRDPHEFFSPTGGRIALSGGEAIMRPEFTRAVGSGFIDYFNRLAATKGVSGVRAALGGGGRTPGFFGGGIIDTISGAGGKALDIASTVGDYLADPAKIFEKLIKTITNQVRGLGDTPWASMVGKFPVAVVKGLESKAVDLLKGILPGGGGGHAISPGVAHWKPEVLTALQLTGQSPELLSTVLRRMNQESGGNPTIVNRTDSNWIAGHPSVGLMQVIEGTFRQYAGPFRTRGPFEYGVSVDPIANLYASMKYALSRYGSLASAYNRAGGYDEGGYLPPGDFGGVFNHTGKPEPVLTAGQWETMKAAASARNAPITVEAPQLTVYLGNDRLTEHVDYRIEMYDAAVAAGITTGRRI
ncbi:transglycosylase SLT domain-containing protein [Streptomyces sp. NPDC008079]|uniref:transglycosylase SLT domain-containing protein n=1 Tax=Streptomyces sp. NPDC008079 TaxID=3364806 RepID=UPI0036E46096